MALPIPKYDPEALWAARYEVRRSHDAIANLRQVDPTIRDLLTRLDEICMELTTELESIEPPLLGAVRFVKIVPGAPA